MNTCYDCVHPLKRMMLIAFAIALGVAPRSSGASPQWHADVRPERAGLPAVSVDVGYAGPYIPAINTPITLHATAGDVPFDGYIGFHFAVNGNHTLDTPVLSRATLRPHQQWTFATIASLRRWGAGTPQNSTLPRELAIEWRDATMQIVGAQSAGTPPWTNFREPLRALCIGCNSVFGTAAYEADASQLPDRAQWYLGFASVVAPLPSWLDVPQRVKEAILGSGVYVVLAGTPRKDQQIDAVTRALLPIVFGPASGAYGRIWPYGTERVASSMSWRAKNGAGTAGVPGALPYVARTYAAAWVADDLALARPLPSMTPISSRESGWGYDTPARRSFSIERRAQILGVLAFLVAVIAWVAFRRNRFAIAAAAVVLVATGTLVARDRMRARAGVVDRMLHRAVAPDIAVTFRTLWQYGPTPLAPSEADRTSVTGDFELGPGGEVRTSESAPSTGPVYSRFDWTEVARWTFRRELAPGTAADSMVILTFQDLHGSMNVATANAPVPNQYNIEGELRGGYDEPKKNTFALPAVTESARMLMNGPSIDNPITLTWATGTAQLMAKRKDVYSSAVCTIPPNIVRAIATSGGVFDVTTGSKRPLAELWGSRIMLQVQEKKP